ncbi:MAG: hypothetical protein ABI036_14525 [Fibrobacteria bacterium]
MMAPNPKSFWVRWTYPALGGLLSVLILNPSSIGAKGVDSVHQEGSAQKVHARNFRTFLPKPGETIEDPSSQVVQVLLDRQDKGDFESYMVQVLFRGKPSDRTVRMLEDRVEIDFFDTGKPSMRFAKIRGGVLEASALDEYYYREPGTTGKGNGFKIKRLVRLTLFMHAKAELKFRDTLDRTLIHFRLPK